MSILYWPFAWIMKFCLLISGQYYLIALFFFALIMQAVLIPFAIKQQKSQVKTAAFKPKEMAIRAKYAGRTDKVTQQKMMTEIQEAQQASGVSAFSGCLSMLPQLLLVFVLFAIVRAPITYSFNFDGEGEKLALYNNGIQLVQSYKDAADPTSEKYGEFIKEMTEYQVSLGGLPLDAEGKELSAEAQKALDLTINTKFALAAAYNNENLPNASKPDAEYRLTKLIKNEDALNLIAEKYGVKLKTSEIKGHFSQEDSDKLPNFAFIGNTSLVDNPDLKNFNILLLIPVLVFLSQFFSTKFSRKFMPQQLGANGKPVGGGLFMEVGLPLISTIFAFNFSAAVGVYWVWRTLISMGQTVLMAKLYPLPVFTEEDYAAAEREMKAKVKKKKRITIEVDEDDTSFDDVKIGEGEGNKTTYTYTEKVDMLTDDDDTPPSNSSDDEML